MSILNEVTCPEAYRYPGFHPIHAPVGVQTYESGIADQVEFLKHYAAMFSSGSAVLATNSMTNATGGTTGFAGVSRDVKGSTVSGVNNTNSTKVNLWTPGDCERMLFWTPSVDSSIGTDDVGKIAAISTAGANIDPDGAATNYGFFILAVDTTNNYIFGTFRSVGG